MLYWPIAQGLEHTSYKRAVPGSSTGGPTTVMIKWCKNRLWHANY